MPLKLLGGGGGAVVPKGAEKQFGPLQVDSCTSVKGCSVVTPKGPLIPPPALGDSSVKNSPRSAYRPNPARITVCLRNLGLQAAPMRGWKSHCRPLRVESLEQKLAFVAQNCLLFPATTSPILLTVSVAKSKL